MALLATGCGVAAPDEPEELCGGSVPASSGSPERAADQAAEQAPQGVDGDGFDDLVISYPGPYGEAEDPAEQAGGIVVVPGGEDGPDSGSAQTVQPGEDGIPDSPEEGARFGEEPLLGDFDGDGHTDFAFDAGAETDAEDDAGTVALVWGGEDGVDEGAVVQGTDRERPRVNAVGDFDGDGVSDMLIGGSSAGDEPTVLYGPFGRDGAPARSAESGIGMEDGGKGLVIGDMNGDGRDDVAAFHAFEEMAYDTTVWTAAVGGDGSDDGEGDGDGDVGFDKAGAVAAADEGVAADVDGDGYGDLVLHETGTTVEEGPWSPGKISVFPGGPDGPAAEPASELTLDGSGLPREAEDGDHFGRVLAAGDVNADGYADVAAAVNRPVTAGNPVDEGDVVVLPGGPDGLTGEGACLLRPEDADQYPQAEPAPEDEYWDEYDETPRTLLRLLDTDGDGADDVAVGAPSSMKSTDDAAPGPVRVYRGLTDGDDGSLTTGTAQGITIPHEGSGIQHFAS